ncbi:MAG: cupin domain-containing protein [Candidatus Lokiarchaeota archaeon]|nr:cupin domain-containing protein [Candidatus Harpocratesius repetitus]
MKKIVVAEQDISSTPHKVAVRKLLEFPYASYIHITLKPGETLKKHITPVDACFYGLDGIGKVEIGDEIETLSKDEIVFSPAGIVHRLFNEESNTKDFKFLVIKTPTPQNQPTKIL